MIYGIIKVDDIGSPGVTNTALWANWKGTKTRAEFESDASARAYIRDVILPERGVAVAIAWLRQQGFTTKIAPARHDVYYAWPLPAVEEQPDQEASQDATLESGQARRPSSRRAGSRDGAASERELRLL